jgi:hypothetical protein
MDLGALEMWYSGSRAHGVRLKGLVTLREETEEAEEEQEQRPVVVEDDVVEDVESGLGSVPNGLHEEWELEAEEHRRRRRRTHSLLEADLIGMPACTPIHLAGEAAIGQLMHFIPEKIIIGVNCYSENMS